MSDYSTDVLDNQKKPAIKEAQQLAKEYRIAIGQAINVVNGKLPLHKAKADWTPGELLGYDFPEPKWIVPGLLPEGLSILAGRPKIGKSWLALQILRSVSSNGVIFDQQCEPRKCLYLAVEDSDRRLKSRIKIQQWQANENVMLVPGRLKHPLNSKEGLKWFAETIADYEFVIIDTIGKATKGIKTNDSDALAPFYDTLHAAAMDSGISIMLIDHMNKTYEGHDFLDSVMGGTAKTAIVDTIMGLRKERNQIGATLEITGRDVDESELSLEWHKETCTWICLGPKDEVIADRTMKKLVRIVEQLGDKATQKEITKESGWKQGTVSKNIKRAIDEGFLIDQGYNKPYLSASLHNAEKDILEVIDSINNNNNNNNNVE